MYRKLSTVIGSLSLCVMLGLPLRSVAQSQPTAQPQGHHHYYKLVDLGTLGGTNSFTPFGGTRTLNSSGTVVIEADTPVSDPYSPNCFQAPGCLINHSLQWRNGTSTDLGALPGMNSSFPLWINSQGWVAGMSENGIIDPLTGGPEIVAVLWKDSEMINLGTLGGNVSEANAVNNYGQVVGGALNTIPDPFSATFYYSFIPFTPGFFFFNVATQVHAFLWQRGIMQDLGTLGGPDSVAWYVNDHGQVAGQSAVSSNPSPTTGVPPVHPFLWNQGKMEDLGGLGGTFSWPSGLNNQGQVVGASNLVGDVTFHPFLWDDGLLKDLGTFDGDSGVGVANAIDDAGEVVGWASTVNSVFGFLWKHGALINLGSVNGDSCSVANGVNLSGQVVGESSPQCSFAFPDDRAVLWENGGQGIDLNTLIPSGSGMDLTVAKSINDRGEIDGDGYFANGDGHAFLLIPCDENHPNITGCDYSLVDAAALRQSEQTAPAQAAIANPAKLFLRGATASLHSQFINHHRHFGASPLK
jgi:probable HAF family extracellular repeat protein